MDIKNMTFPSTKDLIAELLEKKQIPENGWNITAIEYLLSYLSSMDSNNFANKASVGEREGRCFSDLVARRNFHFTHGIGRSGDLTEPQPKAAGSSILYKLTNILLQDLMTIYSINIECLLVPLPIGICLLLCLSMFHKESPQHVLWFRENNENIFNAIVNSGFVPVILNPITDGDDATKLSALVEEKIHTVGVEKVGCVISSTACILPRCADNIKEISKICKKYEIPHIIISECGLQNRKVMSTIKESYENGRIDAVLQNPAENFLVPAGSTLFTSPDMNVIEKFSKIYPGRASSSSVIDIFVTLLSLGKTGYSKLLDDKERIFLYLQNELFQFSERYKPFIGKVCCNFSSFGLSYSKNIENVQLLKQLVHSRTSIKVHSISLPENRLMLSYNFEDWGNHGVNYPTPFIIFTLSIHTTKEEIDYLFNTLNEALFNKL